MTKTVSLPDLIYAELVSVSGDLTAKAKKPISLGMAVYLLITIYRGIIAHQPQTRESIKTMLATMPIASPEEWEKTWNKYSEEILKGEKQ